MLKRIAVGALAAIAGFALSAPHAGAAGCPVGYVTFSGSGTPSSRFHVAVARQIVEKGWACGADEYYYGRGASMSVIARDYALGMGGDAWGLNALARGVLDISMDIRDREIWDRFKAAGKVVEPGGVAAAAGPAAGGFVGMNAKFAQRAGPITAMLSKYRLDAKALVYMRENRYKRNEKVAADFLRNNEAVWTKWVPSDVAAKIKAALAKEAEENAPLEALLKLAERHDRKANKGRKLSEKAALAKLSGNLCNAFLENDFSALQGALKNGSKRLLGREVPLEKAYLYARCDQPEANNCDLLRVLAEDPMVSNLAARDMVLYFTRYTPNRALLGKILRCRRDFGFGCVDVPEHLEKNAQIALRAGLKYKARMLQKIKTSMLEEVGEKHLKRDRGFCRRFLDEPRTCGDAFRETGR